MGSLLGIEIGNSNIKIVHGQKNGKILHVMKYGIVPTPAGAVKDGYILDIHGVHATILELIYKQHIQEKNAAIIVQGTGIITRDVEMPMIPEKEMQTVLEYQKEDYFPIDVTNYQTDFKILREVDTKEGKRYNVMLVAAPNAQIEQSLDLLGKLHLRPKVIDILSNSAAKVFGGTSTAAPGEQPFAVMVIDIGGYTTTVTIVSEGVVLFSRAILYGFSELDLVIASEFASGDLVGVEEFKRKYAGIYEEDMSYDQDLYGAHISSMIKPMIDNNLIWEIQRFMEFYQSRDHKVPLKSIHLVGGGAYLKNLDEYISKVFHLPTYRGVPLDHIRFKNAERMDQDYLYLLNVLGLVYRD